MSKFNLTSFQNTRFSNSQLAGIDWTLMKWPRKSLRNKPKFDISFTRCELNYSIFIALEMYKAQFDSCFLDEVCFEDADLEKAVFDGCNLSGASFNHTNLESADFSTARNYSINVQTNRVKKAKFSLPEAISLLYAMDIEI